MNRMARGGLGWVLQVLSGIGLLFLVSYHLLRMHIYGSSRGVPTYREVIRGLKNPLVVFFELLLTLLVLYHALYGLRCILVESGLFSSLGKIDKVLYVVGVATFTYVLALTLYLHLLPPR